MKHIDETLDAEEFVPTLYTTDHYIQQSEEQLANLRLRIAAARGYVGMMKLNSRTMTSTKQKTKLLTWRQRLARVYHAQVERNQRVKFWLAVCVCMVLIGFAVYSWVRD